MEFLPQVFLEQRIHRTITTGVSFCLKANSAERFGFLQLGKEQKRVNDGEERRLKGRPERESLRREREPSEREREREREREGQRERERQKGRERDKLLCTCQNDSSFSEKTHCYSFC